MKRQTVWLGLVASLLAGPAPAAEPLRLGFVAAQSGPLGVIGSEQKRGLDLALEHLGNQLGGRPVEVVNADSKGNPGAAVQEAAKLIEKDKVPIITGGTGSNEVMAMVKPIVGAGVIFLGSNGGPSPLAGRDCSENYFSLAFQNDQWSEGMGAYMTRQGVKTLYLIGMDYQAGWDHIGGARRFFKGDVAAQVFTPQAQLDFSAEMAQIRAAAPDAVFAFYPGGAAVSFVKQYAQAGLNRKIPLYSNVGLSDPLFFQAQVPAALGITVTGQYSSELDNPANKRFVADYRAKYGRDPATYAAQQYDAVMLLDSALKQTGGRTDDLAALRGALRKADFHSVRGGFRFNHNHMPIQTIYSMKVERRASGELFLNPVAVAAADAVDSFHGECPMNW